MRNILAIVKRDARRLLHVPAAWIIIFGLVFIPPLYAWFNVRGFWNPYGNTLNIHVAVVNEDRGTDSAIVGKINLGKQIVSKLKTNKQLGWQFAGKGKALKQVKSAESYAAIVIPKDFSERMSNVVVGGTLRPTLQYYVNEKANAVTTKITDTGASSVDKQVNDTFVSTVSKVISKALNEAGGRITASANSAGAQAVRALDTIESNIGKTRSIIGDLNTEMGKIPDKTKQARQTITLVQNLQTSTVGNLSSTSIVLGKAQSKFNGFVGTSSSLLDQSSSLLSKASGQANLDINNIASMLTVANGGVGSAIHKAQEINKDSAKLIKELEDLDLPGTEGIIKELKEQNENTAQSISNLQKINKDTDDDITSTVNSADAINTAAQTTLNNTDKARQNIISGALPKLNSGLSTLSGTSATLGSDLDDQGSLAKQANLLLDQLDHTMASTQKSLSLTDSGLAQLQTKLSNLSTDLRALGSSNALGELFGQGGKLDVGKIADFMLSPTVIDTKVVYPVDSYGSGMSPLFINLSLWVGAFMLMVIFKLEVDDEEIEDLTAGERYWGRWLLLAPVAALQGLVTTVGAMLIGVQTASAPVFVMTAMIASLVYLSITYALSTTFLHVGKGLCVVLVILQIPSTSGLYPIEMMPDFFRNMYPFFPFTYSIGALRETIGGFYRNHWAINMGKLMIFLVLFFVLGLLGRPRLNNLNSLFAREIAESDIINGEPIRPNIHEYGLSQAIKVLTDKKEYREAIEGKAREFAKLYPRLKRTALIAGIVVPAILAVTFSFTTGTMLIALAAWIIWILLVIAFLMTIEMARDSIGRQVRLGSFSDETIRRLLYDYEHPRWQIFRGHSRKADRHQSEHQSEGSQNSQQDDALQVSQDPDSTMKIAPTARRQTDSEDQGGEQA